MVPKTTSETLKHKINPSLDQTSPQAVDVLLYTPGESAKHQNKESHVACAQCLFLTPRQRANIFWFHKKWILLSSVSQINQFDLVIPQAFHWSLQIHVMLLLLRSWRRTGFQISCAETALGRVHAQLFPPPFQCVIISMTQYINVIKISSD